MINPYIIIGIVIVAIIGGLAFVMKEQFIILAFYLFLFGILGIVLYLAYRWLFPPGWQG